MLPSPPETPAQAKARRKRNTLIAAVLIAVILVASAYSAYSAGATTSPTKHLRQHRRDAAREPLSLLTVSTNVPTTVGTGKGARPCFE